MFSKMSKSIEWNFLSDCIRDTSCLSRAIELGIGFEEFKDNDNQRLFMLAKKFMDNGHFSGTSIGYLHDFEFDGLGDRINELLELFETSASFDLHLKRFCDSLNKEDRLTNLELLKSAVSDNDSAAISKYSSLVQENRFSPEEVLLEPLASIAKRCRPWEEFAGVYSCGVHKVDRACGLLRKGEILTVAGRPGEGKTAFGCQAAIENAASGKSVLFISIEMTREEIFERLAKQVLGSDVLNEENNARLIENVSKLDITICDSIYDISSIEQIIRRLSNRPQGLDFVVLDYIGEVDDAESAPGEAKHQKIDRIIKKIRKLVKKTKTTLVMLAQLNRGEGVPTLKNIADSDSIPRGSHRVILLYRDDKDALDKALVFKTIVKVEKNRTGCIVDFELDFHGPIYTFKDRKVFT